MTIRAFYSRNFKQDIFVANFAKCSDSGYNLREIPLANDNFNNIDSGVEVITNSIEPVTDNPSDNDNDHETSNDVQTSEQSLV